MSSMKIQKILRRILWQRSARSPSLSNLTILKPSCTLSKIPISLRPSQPPVLSSNTVLPTAPCRLLPLLSQSPRARPRRTQRPPHQWLHPAPCKHRMLLLLPLLLRLPPLWLLHQLSDQHHNHQRRRPCHSRPLNRCHQHPRTLLEWERHLEYPCSQSHHLEEWRSCSPPVLRLRPLNRDLRTSHRLWRPRV